MRKPDERGGAKAEGPEGPGKTADPIDYIKAARARLREGNHREAYGVLQQAIADYPENALILSYFGCLQAIVDRKYRSGIDACRRALALFKAPDKYSIGVIYPILYLNLGRACLAAGRKQEAIEAFIKGLKYDRSHRELKKELVLLGIRKQPVVPFLSRSNPINKYIGMLLHSSRKDAKRRPGR
jgi:tetratricopeptide (TPR) repeat protein